MAIPSPIVYWNFAADQSLTDRVLSRALSVTGTADLSASGVNVTAAGEIPYDYSADDWLTQGQGVFYIRATANASIGEVRRVFDCNNLSGTADRVSWYASDSTTDILNIRAGNVTIASTADAYVGSDLRVGFRLVISYEDNSMRVFMDGNEGTEDTSGTIATNLNRLVIGTQLANNNTTQIWGSHIQEFAYYDDPADFATQDFTNLSDGTVNADGTVTVPDVVGLTQAAATTAITDAQLTLGTVTTAYSGSVDAGDVISQDPAASSSASEGSGVDIVVSLGPEPAAEPVATGHTASKRKMYVTINGADVLVSSAEEAAQLRELFGENQGLPELANKAIRKPPRAPVAPDKVRGNEDTDDVNLKARRLQILKGN